MSLDDLRDVIATEAVSVTITRKSDPPMAVGRPSGVATTTTISTKASIQPVPTKELEFMPEGFRARGMVKVFSPIELLVVPYPDNFVYLGSTWELVKVDDWSDLAGYWRCFAVRMTQP